MSWFGIRSFSDLLPVALVTGVGVGIYILFRTLWTDEPKKRKEGSDDAP